MNAMKTIAAAAILLASWFPVLAHAGAAPQSDALQGTKQYGNSERGKEVVSMWCVSCHSAGSTADDRIPSLQALAAKALSSDQAIRTFLMQPHKPMPPLEIGTQQIEDIIAYFRALTPGPRGIPAPPASP